MAKMKLSNNKKKKIREMVEQANQAFASGRYDISERLCRKIESLQPGHPDVANMRAVMSSYQGETDKAEKLFMDAIQAAPKRGAFHANLGAFYLAQQRVADALHSYRQAIRLESGSLSIQFGYCTALIQRGDYEEAYNLLQRARKSAPSDQKILKAMFRACYGMNRIHEAEECLRAVLACDPEDNDALFHLGKLNSESGQFDEAEKYMRRALAIKPDDVRVYAKLVEFKRYNSADDADVVAMASLYERADRESSDRASLGFALGKVMENIGDYDRAFSYFKEANDYMHRQSDYDNDRELGHIIDIIDNFTPEVLSQTSGLDDATPIFIVGMPRCGSTLTEQILASHPDVYGMGESNRFGWDILNATCGRDTPLTLDLLLSLSSEQWRDVGMTHLRSIKSEAPDALRITDKSLNNYRLIGAIRCALPKARIVHVRRHPLDTCLSIYKLDFMASLFDYGYSLGELGYYYRMYLRLMEHWRNVLPAGVMYEFNYEDMVADQEGETRKLLAACGLSWSDQCLQFNKSEKAVRTASVAQVRRSIYKDSVSGWKRYEKHFEPLIKILGTEYNHPAIMNSAFNEAFE